MKWRPIRDDGRDQVYAWASDVIGYQVSLAYVGDDKKFNAWFKGEPLHEGTVATPKNAQRICEDHHAGKNKQNRV